MCRTASLLLLAGIICRAGLTSGTFTNCLARCPFLAPDIPIVSRLVEWLRGGWEWKSRCEVGKSVALLVLFFLLLFSFFVVFFEILLALGKCPAGTLIGVFATQFGDACQKLDAG